MSAGANIIQWQMHPGAEIRWKIHKHGGHYTIESKFAHGKYLNAAGNKTHNGV